MSQDGFTAIPFGISLSIFLSFKTCWNVVLQDHLTEWHDHLLPAFPTKTKLHKFTFMLTVCNVFTHSTFVAPEEGLFCKPKYRAIFLFHTFFYFTYFVFCVFVSLTAVRIRRSVYFFTSNVLLIQVYLRSGNVLSTPCRRNYPIVSENGNDRKFLDFSQNSLEHHNKQHQTKSSTQ